MGVNAAVDWAEKIARDDSHGYSQAVRWAPDYDCSSFVISALEAGGFPMRSYGATYTGNMGSALKSCGFRKLSKNEYNLTTGAGLIRGDVLLNPATHTELYAGNGRAVGAHSSETGGKYGKIGDQTGNEISIQNYRNKNYTEVWRHDESGQPFNPDKSNFDSVAWDVIRGNYGNGAERIARLRAAGYSDSEINKIQQTVNYLLRK